MRPCTEKDRFSLNYTVQDWEKTVTRPLMRILLTSAWILWSNDLALHPTQEWEPWSAHETRAQCMERRKDVYARYNVGAKYNPSIRWEFSCFPDTLDPRRRK